MPELRLTIIEALRRSKKYARLAPDAYERIADWSSKRHSDPGTAVKAAKRKLHQIYGAFLSQINYSELDRTLELISRTPSREEIRRLCLNVLQMSISTAERISILPDLYRDLFAALHGPPKTVLDLACGLNPFTLPWMNLPPETEYIAVDVDERLTQRIDRFFRTQNVTGTAQCRDLLTWVPDEPSDLALLFKTLPTFEQQERRFSHRLFKQIHSRAVAVSFPAKSLGGREKGMQEQYRLFMQNLSEQLGRPMEQLNYSTETFFLIHLQDN